MKEPKPPTRQELLDALSRYQKQGRIRVSDELIERVVAEESDRGLVIILSSWIEDLLLDRIFEELPRDAESQRAALTKGGGPLRDFGARALMARALNIIDDETKAMVDVFRAMRNACAHSRQDINFRTPELREVLALLFSGSDAETIRSTQEETVLTVAFVCIAGYVLGIISGEPKEGAKRRINSLITEHLEELAREEAQRAASQETPTDTLLPDFRPDPTNTGR